MKFMIIGMIYVNILKEWLNLKFNNWKEKFIEHYEKA